MIIFYLWIILTQYKYNSYIFINPFPLTSDTSTIVIKADRIYIDEQHFLIQSFGELLLCNISFFFYHEYIHLQQVRDVTPRLRSLIT